MDSQYVLEQVALNQSQSTWVVFNYKASRHIYRLCLNILFIVLFGWFIVDKWKVDWAGMTIILVFQVFTLWIFIMDIWALIAGKMNVLVFTDTEIVKCWRGKVQSISYEEIEDVKIERIRRRGISDILLFLKYEDKPQRLLCDASFGPWQQIYSTLQLKWKLRAG